MTILFNRIETKERRRELRRRSTVAEDRLWEFLKNRKLAGQKFRRQFAIGNFYVDFYCPKFRLIIEVDGSIHDVPENKIYDRERQKSLESLGLVFLRFKNSDVKYRIETVLKTIADFFQTHPNPSST
ncbi:MAG: endonuclease domain-containing protein [Candidatus Uhrbacteria bacterium]